ncbi:MAG: gfo/Idh/MocA family oxidoreductase [Candidatus Solibacter sp.]|nr:gfo/Idh/MocA family oxidoreductase [Candidatus Solibacter sp.]
MTISAQTTSERRSFLASSGSAIGLMILKPETAFGSQANSAVEIGIIGAGGRGNWIGDFFVKQAGARITALADAFVDRLETSGSRFGVPESRRYRGLESYQELIASKVDAVAIETPPYFHPEQVAAAVAAGKHVFLAKPVAVDVPGCLSILESGERAKGKVSFLVDFQTRAQPAYQEAAARVHRGDIGAPVLGHVYYHGSGGDSKPRPGWGRHEARLRMWPRDRALSGDIIVEQNIHAIDVANWFLGGRPVKASGMGGRKVRLNYGDCWDYFVVTFWYPNNVTVDFSSAQFVRGFYDICVRVYGPLGTVDSHYGLGPRFEVDPRLDGHIAISGANPWKAPERDKTFDDGALANVMRFVESIRTGKLLNNAAESVDSNLACILGRMAAYRGGAATWDEMMELNIKLEAGLTL